MNENIELLMIIIVACILYYIVNKLFRIVYFGFKGIISTFILCGLVATGIVDYINNKISNLTVTGKSFLTKFTSRLFPTSKTQWIFIGVLLVVCIILKLYTSHRESNTKIKDNENANANEVEQNSSITNSAPDENSSRQIE